MKRMCGFSSSQLWRVLTKPVLRLGGGVCVCVCVCVGGGGGGGGGGGIRYKIR